MAERHVVRAAISMRGLAQRTARHAVKAPQRAVIIALGPLQIEMTQAALTLDSSQFTLSHSVRQYDAQYGLAVGDTLIMTPVAGGELVATAVLTVADSTQGAAKQAVGATGEVIGGGSGTPLVGKVPFYGDDGSLVGYIPLV